MGASGVHQFQPELPSTGLPEGSQGQQRWSMEGSRPLKLLCRETLDSGTTPNLRKWQPILRKSAPEHILGAGQAPEMGLVRGALGGRGTIATQLATKPTQVCT